MRQADFLIALILALAGPVHSQPPTSPTIRLGDLGSIEAVDFNPDRRSPSTKDWVIRTPDAGTHQPLVVELDESLDHALLQSMIDVYDTTGFVEGTVALEDSERVWHFTPREPWREGTCELRINVLLEDLAGNRLDRLFDVDMIATEEQTMEDLGEWVTKRFSIQKIK